MDNWFDIIENYDLKKEKSRDHEGYSQKSAVLLLMYLAFGADYPHSIAKYFAELEIRPYTCPSILKNSNKISSMLKKMHNDGLIVLLKQVTVKAGTRKYYALDPQILQSPIRNSTMYIKRDGSSLSISLEIIKNFLDRLSLNKSVLIPEQNQEQFDEQLREARHKRADLILSNELMYNKKADFVDFLSLIKDEAIRDDSANETKSHHNLGNLIHEYIFEIRNEIREWESCID